MHIPRRRRLVIAATLCVRWLSQQQLCVDGVGSAIRTRVRICANKVVAGVRCSTLLPNIRPQETRQFASAQQIDQLEGLAVAIPWGFESPLPHHQIEPVTTGSPNVRAIGICAGRSSASTSRTLDVRQIE